MIFDLAHLHRSGLLSLSLGGSFAFIKVYPLPSPQGGDLICTVYLVVIPAGQLCS